jgi:hypothetical protein
MRLIDLRPFPRPDIGLTISVKCILSIHIRGCVDFSGDYHIWSRINGLHCPNCIEYHSICLIIGTSPLINSITMRIIPCYLDVLAFLDGFSVCPLSAFLILIIPGHQTRPGADFELTEYGLHVLFNRVQRDDQAVCDFLIGQTQRYKFD